MSRQVMGTSNHQLMCPIFISKSANCVCIMNYLTIFLGSYICTWHVCTTALLARPVAIYFLLKISFKTVVACFSSRFRDINNCFFFFLSNFQILLKNQMTSIDQQFLLFRSSSVRSSVISSSDRIGSLSRQFHFT